MEIVPTLRDISGKRELACMNSFFFKYWKNEFVKGFRVYAKCLEFRVSVEGLGFRVRVRVSSFESLF